MRTVPVPRPSQPNQVLIQVHTAGVNPVDAKYVVGDKVPTPITRFIRKYFLCNKIPGFDFSGTVVEASNGFQVGDAVFGTVPPFCGTLAEYIVAPSHQISFKPEALSWEQAAALPLVGITAVQCLQEHVVAGETHMLVLGASGGTGHVAIQVGRALGAAHVTAVCSSGSAEFCRECGAHSVLDYQQDLVAQLQEERRKYHVILDCVSSSDPRDAAHGSYPQLLQPPVAGERGELLLAPWLAPNYVYRRLGGSTIDWVHAGVERTIGWSFWNQHEKLFWIRFQETAAALKQLAEWADKSLLAPRIAVAYDFSAEGVKRAMDAIMGRHVRGKVVIAMTKPET